MAIKFYSLSFYMYEEAKLFILNSVLELLVVSKVSETSGNYIKKKGILGKCTNSSFENINYSND